MKRHGNTGKRNAALDDEQLSVVHIKVPRAEKARWVNQAQAKGLKLSEFIRRSLVECTYPQ